MNITAKQAKDISDVANQKVFTESLEKALAKVEDAVRKAAEKGERYIIYNTTVPKGEWSEQTNRVFWDKINSAGFEVKEHSDVSVKISWR